LASILFTDIGINSDWRQFSVQNLFSQKEVIDF